jgi:RNA polymerase sigma factor (sigma-70 family)
MTKSPQYNILSDKEIIRLIITKPYDDEAAAYLLYNRYQPKFKKLCREIYGNEDWYGDCMGDLFNYLKGNELDWKKLSSFQWRSQFSTWIGKTARNRFLEIKPYLTGKIENLVSIDNQESTPIQLPDHGEEDYENQQQRILLLEAIGQLTDSTQKFVMLKTLQGYNSSDTARLLKKKWDKDGTVRYNHKKEEVVPSASYVDLQRERAKKELKKIISPIL